MMKRFFTTTAVFMILLAYSVLIAYGLDRAMRRIESELDGAGAAGTSSAGEGLHGFASSGPDGETPGRPDTTDNRTPEPGLEFVRALSVAFPDRIEETGIRDGEWAVRVADTWYHYADGRFLPENERANRDTYTGIRFYTYSPGPPILPEIDQDTAQRLRTRTTMMEMNPPVRHNGFLDSLYGISTQQDAESLMVRIGFLGRTTRVHPVVVAPLSRVETEVRTLESSDPEVARFVRGLRDVSGFHWRQIAGTRSRSYHAYGLAVDLIPTSYERKYGYWRWALDAGEDEWWSIPLKHRWSVPQPVVDAFERQGFIWGGKWLAFDPIHFEYRPEVFTLNAIRAGEIPLEE
jgi:hypothetical protein